MVRTKVFVGNLSFQIKEAELATEFASAGKVISANIITRGPRSLGYGFVEMDSEEDAQKAVQVMNKKEVNGRPINVEIAKPQDESKKTHQPKEGGAVRRRRRRPAPRRTDENGEEGGENAEGEKGDGRRRRRPRRAPRKRVSNEDKVESKTTLFVANLPFSLDDDGFSKIVTDLNLKLKAAHVVKKRNGRSKGYGFIEFDEEADQLKGLEALNKKVVDERELSVKIALTEKKTEGETTDKEAKVVPKPVEKKVVTAEKKAEPTEKKASPPPPAEKKAPVAEKKVTPVEKKTTPPPPSSTSEKKSAPPAEKKAAPAEKKAAPVEKKAATPEKKAATPEKKEDKK